MKTLNLSGIALLFLSIFTSCEKSTDSLVEDGFAASALRVGTPGPATPGASVNPSLVVVFNPDPAMVNETVMVVGTFNHTTGVTVPDCGKLQLQQKINGDWVTVADEDVTASAHAVTYDFIPTVVGDDAYEFRLHFIKSGGGCNAFNNTFSDSYFLDVERPCVSTFTITPSVSAENKGGGLYEFTVNYTLTSPVDVSGVKFQGGATAGGNSGHSITDFGNTSVVNANNNNTVLKWEGNLIACTPQTITFKYTRNFSCPAAAAIVTGGWSASQGASLLGTIDPLPYTCE